MKKARIHKGDAFASIHQAVSDMHEAGAVGKQTMLRFDGSCLIPVHQFTPEEIRVLRDREEVSRVVFARYLNVTKESISQWERGEKKPAEPSMKLLSLVKRKGLGAIAW
ncbi:DNA-binding transcriptional regulator [Chlorobium sp. N1]|uniref:helix-turn-helix domain-containing protein n=1 Tax=Chlorobium sp. N1 TaxID=2491138 RepID=UPI00103C8D6D|nr:DNA-binding transcriptional regulator [Chlorobium sp. N1]TCD47206.1 DNA-binding transcriptional regulator [Chlorobium sp. N1]